MRLRAVKLSTKLTLLVTTGVAAALALGVPGAIDRIDRSQAASDVSARVSTLRTLVRFHELSDREATLSAWFVASGELAALRTLTTVRPEADREARSLAAQAHDVGGPLAASVARVERAWAKLRETRATIDTRIITDATTLARFDAVSGAIRQALDAGSVADTGAANRALRSRAAIDELRNAVAREQAAIAVALARASISAQLLDRLRASAAAQSTGRAQALASARDSAGPSVDTQLDLLRSSAAVVRTTRAPALLGVPPFITPTEWEQRSDDQIRAITTLGRSLDVRADDQAAAASRAGRAGVVRWLVLLGAIVAGVIVIALLLTRAVRRPLRAVRDTAVDLADRERAALTAFDTARTKASVAPLAVTTD
ncbi:MAG: nitrate- and nitrite sensing domain-containing protein, partial [Acidimicrobiia bacterium]